MVPHGATAQFFDDLAFLKNDFLAKESQMVTIVRLSDKPCFLCNSHEDTAEVRFKDRTFSGVVCKQHLFELINKRVKGTAKPRAAKPSEQT